MANKTVKDVMHMGLVTCPVYTPIPAVARLMIKLDVSAIAVTDEDGLLAGLIARTDLTVLYGFQDMWPHLVAEQAMVSKVATIAPDELATKAAQIMTERKYHRLIVTEMNGQGKKKPVGVVSMTDIVRDMALA